MRFYPMGVVATGLFGRTLTRMSPDAWRGIDELCAYLDATRDDVRLAILVQYPEFDVDASGVQDWDRFVHGLRARFGVQVEFEEAA